MQQRALGRLSVPVVGLGTSETLDLPGTEQDLATSIVTAALDAGSTLIDTSPMYGKAEARLGAALSDQRSRAQVATKVWTGDDAEAEHQIQASLDYYSGHVELFQVHNLIGWPKRLDQLERHRDAGRITTIGVTHWQASAFGELEQVMRSGRIDAIQIPYNPRERDVEQRILPLAADLGLGVLVMRPFGAGGLLSAAPSQSQLEPLAEAGITSWAAALLAWVLADERVSGAIPASSKPERVTSNAEAGSIPRLDESQREFVQRLASVR